MTGMTGTYPFFSHAIYRSSQTPLIVSKAHSYSWLIWQVFISLHGIERCTDGHDKTRFLNRITKE
jgi:hypothetical protein